MRSIIKTKPVKPKLKHLLSVEVLSKETIFYIFERAELFLKKYVEKEATDNILSGKVVCLIFFESSTRTRNSFIVAAERLGAIVVSPDMQHSATVKGESLIDTVHTLEAMGANLLVLRHPDNNAANFVVSELSQSRTAMINAGDGSNEHPTQCLTDLFTIYNHFKDFSTLKIAIIGDILHSRVARSLVHGLKLVGVEDIRLVGPENFMPDDSQSWGCQMFSNVAEGLADVNVIYALRIQKERLAENESLDFEKYHEHYSISEKNLEYAAHNVVVMHPGPINRGVEIESRVADGEHSVILEQVTNGVAMRMALLDLLLN